MNWWEGLLVRWARALDIEYEIERAPMERETVPFGHWKFDGERWQLGLGASLAQFQNGAMSADVREALSWTLQAMRQDDDVDHVHPIATYYDECMRRPLEELARDLRVAGTGSSNVSADPAVFGSMPGYFMTLSPILRRDGSTSEDLDHAREVIVEVLEATFPSVWHVEAADGRDILLFVTMDAIKTGFEELALWNAQESSMGGVPVRAVVEHVSTAVREEGLLDVYGAVSMQVQKAEDIGNAIVSLCIASQIGRTHSRPLSIFGDRPTEFLLSVVNHDVRQAILWMVSARSSTNPANWPHGWMELTRAMLKANLNVSEAARLMYVHRNTLLARIEKLHEETSFDARVVDDLMVLHLAAGLLERQAAQD